MPTYTASIQIMGFLAVEVEAASAEEAKAKIEKAGPDSISRGDVESMVFSSFETEPEEEP